jgi:hypothetical protein
MRNDYTDYIQHGFHKYVAKVKTASGNKYFYTQDEYNAYLRGGRQPGIHQTPTRGLDGAAYTVKSKVNNVLSSAKSSLNKTKNTAINGRMPGIHQTPTRGLSGAAYTAKNKVGKAVKSAGATIGSTKVTSAKNGPQAPASIYGKHKVNNATNRVKNAAVSIRDKTIGAPDSNSAYRVVTRKAKRMVGDAGRALDRTFGHGEKNNRMNAPERAISKAKDKINSLHYKVTKKIDNLKGDVSENLAAKMSKSVQKLRNSIRGSGASSEEIKMMNDKLDKIMAQIEESKKEPMRNTGSHPAYNQGVVTYKDYTPSRGSKPSNNQGVTGFTGNKAAQGSRPTDNQGYVSAKNRKKYAKAASGKKSYKNMAENYKKAVNSAKAERKRDNMTAAERDYYDQMNNLLSYAKKKKKK